MEARILQSGKLPVKTPRQAKKSAYVCKSIAIEVGGVSRYFSEVSGSAVDFTLPIVVIEFPEKKKKTHFWTNFPQFPPSRPPPKRKFSSKPNGPGEQGATGYCPKIALLKRAKMVLSPFHTSHREICTRNRQFSETKVLDDFWGPHFSPIGSHLRTPALKTENFSKKIGRFSKTR